MKDHRLNNGIYMLNRVLNYYKSMTDDREKKFINRYIYDTFHNEDVWFGDYAQIFDADEKYISDSVERFWRYVNEL